MATHKIHIPWNTQKLKGLFADNRLPSNKNKIAFLSLLFVASIAIGIFIVNVIKLVNSETLVKTTMNTERREAAPIERTGTELLQTAPQAAPVETAPIQTAPPLSVDKKPAAPTPKVESTDRFTIDSYLYRAREHEIKGEYSKALASYKKVLDREENNFIVMNNISYIYLQMDFLKESIEYSIKSININRDYVPALTNIGIVYAKIGDLPTAEYHFTRALKLEPTNQDVILNLALFHEKQNHFPEAFKHYLRLVRSGNLIGALGLARVYEKEGRTAEAIKFYKNIYNSGSIDSKTRVFVRQRILILQNKQREIGK